MYLVSVDPMDRSYVYTVKSFYFKGVLFFNHLDQNLLVAIFLSFFSNWKIEEYYFKT